MRRDDRGISNVVGAFLLFALLVTTLTVIQVEFVPRWDEEREARHMQTVGDQMRSIRSDLDRQVDNRTSLVQTDPLKLGTPGGFTFFRSEELAGYASFAPSNPGEGLEVASTQLRLQSQSGQATAAQEGTWVGLADTSVPDQPPTDVLRMQHLRVRVTNPGGEADGDCFRLTVRDADGAVTGTFTVETDAPGLDDVVYVTVAGASGQTLYHQGTAFRAQSGFPDYFLDALDPAYPFGDVLAATKTPYDVETAWGATCGGGNLDGARYVSLYERAGNGGVTYQAGDSGVVIAPYHPGRRPAGALLLHKDNEHYPEQTFWLEHGGILVEQPDGTALAVEPRFTVGNPAAGRASLEWWIPGLDGGADAVSGTDSADVILTPTASRLDVRGQVPCVRITVPTAHPTVWRDFWTDRLVQGGFPVYTHASAASPPSADCPASTVNCPGDTVPPLTDTCHFAVTTTADTATLVFFGPTAAPGSTAYDISLAIRQATVHVDLRASG